MAEPPLLASASSTPLASAGSERSRRRPDPRAPLGKAAQDAIDYAIRLAHAGAGVGVGHAGRGGPEDEDLEANGPDRASPVSHLLDATAVQPKAPLDGVHATCMLALPTLQTVQHAWTQCDPPTGML